MEMSIHVQLLGAVFAIAVILGAVTSKTNFCAMGAVSDWVNIGDTGRMRAWVFSMAVALAGVVALEATGTVNLSAETFPPYRTGNFAWIRYLLGGLLFGVGMTVAGGCGAGSIWRAGEGQVKLWVAVACFALAASAGRLALAESGALSNLGAAVFLPAWLGWGGALVVTVAVMAAWALAATWNEDSRKFSAID